VERLPPKIACLVTQKELLARWCLSYHGIKKNCEHSKVRLSAPRLMKSIPSWASNGLLNLPEKTTIESRTPK